MIVPVLRFEGDDWARMMNAVFAENLHDMVSKVDDGKGEYEAGYFHTSTIPHEGTCYYHSTWTRDAGRGLIELCRLGFAEQAQAAAEYLLRHINHGDHWGRTADRADPCEYETNGNALILLGVYNAWKITGKQQETGRRYLETVRPVIDWAQRLMEQNPHGYLMPCQSEMAGNPNTPYTVSAIYPNYAMKLALHGLAGMARFCGEQDWACRLSQMENQLTGAISGYLVSGVSNKGHTNTPAGCWINGLDNRDGRPYDFAEWDDTMWPAYHWTRQLPFILQSDLGMLQLPEDGQRQVHLNSYDYIHSYMRKGEYFRRYGFVSGSGWTGMGERHDDTMCGYSQGFMTQAAMVSDDVNTYSKLLEGVARLAYDGSVVEPLAYEMNPWVMHECFSYDNYAKAMDHTFGTYHMGRPGVANNPGDEGNLVQEAEIVKALALCAGVDDSTPGVLRLLPRIPWNWSGITAENLPYVKENGELVRISFSMQHDRATRRCRFHFESSQPVERLEVRLGPFPRELHTLRKTDYECQQGTDSSWVWLRNLSGSQIDEEIDLW